LNNAKWLQYKYTATIIIIITDGDKIKCKMQLHTIMRSKYVKNYTTTWSETRAVKTSDR